MTSPVGVWWWWFLHGRKRVIVSSLDGRYVEPYALMLFPAFAVRLKTPLFALPWSLKILARTFISFFAIAMEIQSALWPPCLRTGSSCLLSPLFFSISPKRQAFVDEPPIFFPFCSWSRRRAPFLFFLCAGNPLCSLFSEEGWDVSSHNLEEASHFFPPFSPQRKLVTGSPSFTSLFKWQPSPPSRSVTCEILFFTRRVRLVGPPYFFPLC